MRRAIHKVELDWQSGVQEKMLRIGSIPVHVAAQQGKLIVWYESDLDQEDKTGLRFVLRHTGNEIPDCAIYLGTAISESGAHVVHVFTEDA